MQLGQILIVLPLCHLLMGAIFIIAYSLSYGNNIVSLVSVEDLFRVSLQSTAFVYLQSLAFPLGFFVARRSRDKRQADIDRISAAIDSEEKIDFLRGEIIKSEARLKRLKVTMFLLVFFTVASAIYIYFWAKIIPYPLLGSIAFMGCIYLIGEYGEDLINSQAKEYLVNFAIGLIVLTIGAGLNEGQRDRRLSFQSASKMNFACKDIAIVRAVSDKYLAITNDEERVVISSTCQVLFRIGSDKSDIPKDGYI